MSREVLLDVKSLGVTFITENGPITAVKDVSFDVGMGEVLCIVGESGSGKTVSLLSVLGLLDRRNTRVEGCVTFRDQSLLGLKERELRRIRGKQIAFISQDPMTALTPVHTIGDQIIEQIRAHESITRSAARERAVSCVKLDCPAQSRHWRVTPTSSLAACVNERLSPWRSRATQGC